MNIEIANRLYQYRKQMGLSQEELAEQIGVSRQAVSKWERAEASPDTDNLIALSKVYGVTLDEMLTGRAENAENPQQSTEQEPKRDETAQPEEEKPQSGFNIGNDGDKVHIGFDGIHVHEKNGTKVDIDRHGVFVNENGEQKVYTDADGHIHKTPDVIADEKHHRSMWLKLPYPIVTIIAYVLFGTFNVMGGWHYGWIVFLTIPLYYTLVEAIIKRRPVIFCYPVLAVIIFLILGFTLGAWHPAWVVFLTVPIFYWIVNRGRNE